MAHGVVCHYFLPGLHVFRPSQLQSITALGLYRLILLVEERHICLNDLPRITV